MTSINVCGDCNSDEFYPLEGQYKLCKFILFIFVAYQGINLIDLSVCVVYPINTGTSRVFVAIDLQQHRHVAIKVLPAGIEIADNLIHNTIVPIYEIIASDTHTFVIMKRMDINLNKLIKAQPNMFTHNPDGVAHFIRRVCLVIVICNFRLTITKSIQFVSWCNQYNICIANRSYTEILDLRIFYWTLHLQLSQC